jgi:hypothetical protein
VRSALFRKSELTEVTGKSRPFNARRNQESLDYAKVEDAGTASDVEHPSGLLSSLPSFEVSGLLASSLRESLPPLSLSDLI